VFSESSPRTTVIASFPQRKRRFQFNVLKQPGFNQKPGTILTKTMLEFVKGMFNLSFFRHFTVISERQENVT